MKPDNTLHTINVARAAGMSIEPGAQLEHAPGERHHPSGVGYDKDPVWPAHEQTRPKFAVTLGNHDRHTYSRYPTNTSNSGYPEQGSPYRSPGLIAGQTPPQEQSGTCNVSSKGRTCTMQAAVLSCLTDHYGISYKNGGHQKTNRAQGEKGQSNIATDSPNLRTDSDKQASRTYHQRQEGDDHQPAVLAEFVLANETPRRIKLWFQEMQCREQDEEKSGSGKRDAGRRRR